MFFILFGVAVGASLVDAQAANRDIVLHQGRHIGLPLRIDLNRITTL